jgi:DNA repair protein RadC
MSDVHCGHRQRMKTKFIEHGIKSFTDYEILELLLYYTIPRIDTNVIAHDLITKFGSFSAVFDADIEELCTIKHITHNSATLIKLIPQFAKEYFLRNPQKVKMDNINQVSNFFINQFLYEKEELLKVACLNDVLEITSCNTILKGSPSQIPVDIRKIIEYTYKNKADKIILAHNHPNSDETPSNEDVQNTNYINHILENVGIKLVDHIIVSNNKVYSMKLNDKLI